MRTILTTLCAVAALALCGTAAAQTAKINLDIKPQPMRAALKAFGDQTGFQVLYRIGDVAKEGITSPQVSGELSPREALDRLLANTGLRYEFINERTVRITAVGVTTSRAAQAADLRLAREADSESRTNSRNHSEQISSGIASGQTQEQEITVTGSHIRGIESPASAVYRFGRAEIEQSGIGTTEQFLQSLPQNFGGGNSASTVGGILGGEESNLNYGNGTGVNLRGLGNDSTLVLVNGRRLAPAGVGNFVDISMIPISAVERMEVLADGASAIYGSDAVAGVVNITLRRDFSGAESRARYASVTSGNFDELQLGQIFGTNWSSGSAMLTYEYFDRSQLDSADRAFTEGYNDATWLIPEDSRHSAMVSMEQSFAERVSGFANVSYSKRESQARFNGGFFQNRTDSEVEQYGATAGAIVDTRAGWRTEFAGAYSTNNTFYRVTNPGFTSILDQNSDVYSLDVKTDGDLFEATGGQAKLAFGAQYRRENFDARNNTYFELDRDAKAVFAELFWPLIGSGNSKAPAQRLDLSLAGRFEEYSDFGSTFDPKLGIVWSPAGGLNLRGTIGTSFRAPLLSELRPSLIVDVFSFLFDPVAGTTVPTLFLQGATGSLDAEQSTAWTVGLDAEPAALPGMKLSLTYFDIDFKDRITIPVPFSAVGSVLINEAHYAVAIERNPNLTRVNQLYADPSFYNPDGVLPGEIVAIIDDRLRNVASRKQQGMDFTLGYAMTLASGQLSAQLAGTYLFSMDERVTPSAPVSSLVNTPFYPADLKLRGNLGWSGRAWSASAFLNYIDGYEDARTVTPRAVGSWTTADVSLRYKGFTSGLLEGTELSFSVLNAFDRAPPFVAGSGLNFDATNASALGRFASIQITHRW